MSNFIVLSLVVLNRVSLFENYYMDMRRVDGEAEKSVRSDWKGKRSLKMVIGEMD